MANYGGFSWKRALGITRVKQNIARSTGIPLTKSGRQRKLGAMMTGGRVSTSFAGLTVLYYLIWCPIKWTVLGSWYLLKGSAMLFVWIFRFYWRAADFLVKKCRLEYKKRKEKSTNGKSKKI